MADKQPPATPGSSNQPMQVHSVTQEQVSRQCTSKQRFQLSDCKVRSPTREELDIHQASGSHATGKESSKHNQEVVSLLKHFSQKRKGAINGYEGYMYEMNLIMWLMLEGMKRKDDCRIDRFTLASNMDKAGNFDDIGFEYMFNHNGREKGKLIFLQTKQRNKNSKKYNAEKVTEAILLSSSNRDFTLKKYFMSFKKIMEKLRKINDREKKPTVEDIDFVIFSSAQSSFSTNKGKPSFVVREILDKDSFLYMSEATKDNCYYRLDSDKDKEDNIFNALRGVKLNMPAAKIIFHDFLNRLKLFIDQPDEGELEKKIKDKIQADFKVPPTYVEKVYINLKNEVENLWRDDNSSIIKLTKVETILQKAGRINICSHVKYPVRTFTGRTEELSILNSIIQQSTETTTVILQMTSISGLGGIGKTELARQYIKDYIKDYEGNAIWINAENEETLEGYFRKLATEKLGNSTKDTNREEEQIESIVNEVYKYFENRKYLFVFYNAENREYIKKYLPSSSLTPDARKPYILITSRDQEWKEGIEVYDLSELASEDAMSLVRKELRIPEKDRSQDLEIQNLVDKLQMFPLAIQQAVAYITEQKGKRDFSINSYLHKYEEKTKDLLNSELFRGIDILYGKTTFMTWQITVDIIKSNGECGQLALQIFEIMALLAPDNIERKVFVPLAEGNKKNLEASVRLLVRYSMVNGNQGQNILSVHGLVQQVTRLNLEKQNKMEETLRRALHVLIFIDNQGETHYKSTELVLWHTVSLLSHVDNWLAKYPSNKQMIESDIILPLLRNLFHRVPLSSTLDGYKHCLRRALVILETGYGRMHLDIADILLRLAGSNSISLDIKDNKDLLERVRNILKSYDGQEYSKVVSLFLRLSTFFDGEHELSQKKEVLEMALLKCEDRYDKLHSEILAHLANVYKRLGYDNKQKELLISHLPNIEKELNFVRYANNDVDVDKSKQISIACNASSYSLHGATVAGVNNNGKTQTTDDEITPLHLDAREGDKNVVRLSLINEAEQRAQANYKVTPLHSAARIGHASAITLLLSKQKNDLNV